MAVSPAEGRRVVLLEYLLEGYVLLQEGLATKKRAREGSCIFLIERKYSLPDHNNIQYNNILFNTSWETVLSNLTAILLLNIKQNT